MTRDAELVFDQLLEQSRQWGNHVREILFPRHIYVRVAYGFIGGHPLRPSMIPVRAIEIDGRLMEFQVGDSFTIAGPCGEVTIKEQPKK